MTSIGSTRLVVGMEIHIELATNSKMFASAPSGATPDRYEAEPNTLVDPVVMALPGTLPVINREAVTMSMRVGLALGCDISRHTKWDRKNYYYPDLPKGYQISQYDKPLCTGGQVAFPCGDDTCSVRITRAHLEEDTGKLGHELPGGRAFDGSLVDLNRAGTPLLEVVTEPDLGTADEAVAFARHLHNLCTFLGVTGGIMQRGHMRFEPNINMIITSDDGVEHATPIVEIKNLNSFRALRGAIEHETTRQVTAWQEDGIEMGPGRKTTRGWDDQAGVTLLQRVKEDAHDYRYFPDPDLVPLSIDDEWIEAVRASIPELPGARRQRYHDDYGLDDKDAAALTEHAEECFFFEACVEVTGDGAACAKWLLNAGAKRANERGCHLHELGISPQQLGGIIAMRSKNQIGSSSADELFGMLCDREEDADTVAQEAGLLQVADAGDMEEWISAALAAQPQAAEDFAAGKDAAAGRIIGEVMKHSGGTADPAAVRAKLVEVLRA